MKWNPKEPRPIPFPRANFTYTAPAGMEETCGDLPCFRGVGVAVSCWFFPSWRDRLRFLLTGKMHLTVLMNGHPPVALSVADQPTEPL
jgi:hypothetical protein